MGARAWTSLAALSAACLLSTTRPGFDPLPGALKTEVRLPAADATLKLADALRDDSIPVTRVAPRDGYVETSWFDAATGRPAGGPPLGPDIVRVRGWVAPGRIGHSDVLVELAYRALRDPSVPARELERQVPSDNPLRARVQTVLDSLARRYAD